MTDNDEADCNAYYAELQTKFDAMGATANERLAAIHISDAIQSVAFPLAIALERSTGLSRVRLIELGAFEFLFGFKRAGEAVAREERSR